VLLLLGVLACDSNGSDESGVAAIRRFEAQEASQAVAIDAKHFYAIGNRSIGKYDKVSGRRGASWEGSADGPIQHLNSGVVVEGRLYCANSNYPEVPMTGSVEIWDVQTLEHVASHSFGMLGGSLTWVDWWDGYWWAGIGMYSGNHAEPGKDPSWTSMVQLDANWRRLQGWVFPAELVERFRPMTNSGASWGPDGLLYTTGHDDFEVYAVRLPKAGSVLEFVRSVPVANYGQGIAFDRHAPIDRSTGGEWDLWGVIKQERRVLLTRLAPQVPN
jgi:hypothetical protein